MILVSWMIPACKSACNRSNVRTSYTFSGSEAHETARSRSARMPKCLALAPKPPLPLL